MTAFDEIVIDLAADMLLASHIRRLGRKAAGMNKPFMLERMRLKALRTLRDMQKEGAADRVRV